MRSAPVSIEALEARTLFSGTAASIALSAAVRADQLQVREDLLQFRSDAVGCTLTLLQDISAIKKDDLHDAKTVLPLVMKFRKDVRAMSMQLRLDRLAERQNALADESVIVGDLRKLLLDRGNPTAHAADRAKLLADRIKLQNDLIAGLNSRLATRQNDYNTIVADGQAVVTVAQSDPNASPQLVADLQKWTSDKTTCMNTITGDLQKLIADRTQLVADLTAMQSM